MINSTLSQDCKKLGWNGTHADGKWTRFSKGTGDYRIFQAVRRDVNDRVFYSFPNRRNCDDSEQKEALLSSGDTWAVFVR